ncbi:hypothetical protein [Lonepinella sp. BR2271]|uniref:hypothetical protein n=1 Tax=Lonepinella sp. BR2271 TaxID=3434550 RepID=UPI003F6DF81C
MRKQKGQNKTVLFLVEGETEEKLIKTLKLLGKVQKFNCWNQDIYKLIPRLRASEIYIVYDTDVTTNSVRFCQNIQQLKDYKLTVFLLQQTLNLEDELVKSSNCRNINAIFKTKSKKEFKTQFKDCSNLAQKLKEIDFKAEKLWQGEHEQSLMPLESLRRFYGDLASLER